MEPSSFSSLLETAAANTAKTEFQDTSEKIGRLRATLDAFEKVAWKHAERLVVERVFAALGAAPPASGTSTVELAEVREAFGVALVAALKLIGWEAADVPKDCAPTILVAPPRPAPPPPSVPALRDVPKAAPPRPLPVARPEDIEHAKRVLDEIEELRGQDFAKQSPLRLLPLLQAVAAEARLLVERLPAHHPYHRDLIDRFSRILEIKETAGVSEYINGLSHSAHGDWAKIAGESRKAVARFDKNVTQALEQAAAKKKAKEEEPTAPEVVTKESKFPLLVQYTKGHGPLLLIGGMKIDERLDQVAQNHGFECEWVEIPKNSPRSVESTTARIASGKIGMVVILEHFMSHPVYKALTKACDVSKVNYATAGKGGKGTLDLAFMALEKRLSA